MGRGREEMARVFLEETITLKAESETVVWAQRDPGDENVLRMLEPVSIGDELLITRAISPALDQHVHHGCDCTGLDLYGSVFQSRGP